MSKVSVFRTHRDFFWSLIAALSLSLLLYIDIVSISRIPIVISITIFGGVVTSIGALLVIFKEYDRVIDRAKQKEMIGLISDVFKYPVVISAIGIIYTVLSAFVEIEAGIVGENVPEVTHEMILIFLISYSVFSFVEAISLLRRIIIGESNHSTAENSSSDEI